MNKSSNPIILEDNNWGKGGVQKKRKTSCPSMTFPNFKTYDYITIKQLNNI